MVDERKFNELEMKVICLDKEIVRMDTQAAERYNHTCEKLDLLNGKMDKHIDLHIRREDAVLASAKQQEVEQAVKQEVGQTIKQEKIENEKSVREKLFYPAILLLVAAIATAIFK